MPKYTLREEPVTERLIFEMLPLLEKHRQELSAFQDMRLNIAVERYERLYELGMFKAFIAREGLEPTAPIIGYVAYMIAPNMHYQDYIYGIQDVLYVEPSRRGAMLGSRLIDYADNELRKIGVSVTTQHVKVVKDFEPLLTRLGYKWVEKIYMRRL